MLRAELQGASGDSHEIIHSCGKKARMRMRGYGRQAGVSQRG